MARFLKTRQKSHGKAPGSLIFIGNQKMDKSRISTIEYNADFIEEKEWEEIDSIKKGLSMNKVTWLNIDGVHDELLMSRLKELFDIPDLLMEDMLNTDQRPMISIEEDKIMIILKDIFYDEKKQLLHTEQMSFIIGDTYLITLQEREGDSFDPVRERLRKGFNRTRQSGPDYLCYALIDTLVDLYISNIESLGTAVEKLEETILKETRKDILKEIHRHKTEISYMRKSVRPVKEILTYLAKSESRVINAKTRNYLKDLDDLVTQAIEAIEIYYTMLTDHLTIYHTNLSNKANDVMKVLTIFTSLFIPLTFIVGVYGTNFDNLPELHYKYSYFMMWGIMLLLAGGMFLYFKKKKWL